MSRADRVAPELRRLVRRIPALPLHRRWALAFARAVSRRASTVSTDGVSIAVVVHGGVPVRLYRPTIGGTGSAMLWMHGGGMIAGDPTMDDKLLGEVARELGMVIASVGYRRAPEHPYPAPVDDGMTGWLWLQRNAGSLDVDPSRVAIGGESAGGGLAAALVHRLHDTGGNQPRAQWLMCPMLDDRTVSRRDIGARSHLVWNNRNNRYGWRSYLGVEPGSTTVPDGAVPARRLTLQGLPPTWIGVAALDLFADEDLDYARRLKEADVACTVDLVDGAPHGFQSWGAATQISVDYLHRARSWLRLAVA